MNRRLIAAGALLGLLTGLIIWLGVRNRKTTGRGSAEETPQVIVTPGGVEMVLVPGGWFSMGSSRGEPDETPVHKVWVDSFLIDRHEVTQAQYGKLVIGNPSCFQESDHPVERVRWSEAILYCNARSMAEGLDPCYDEETEQCDYRANGYRLPCEAEWEYACRAATQADYCFGRSGRNLKQYAWYGQNASKKTHPVAQKEPNRWGLFDMHGNVAEWCNDHYSEDYYRHSPKENPRGPAEGQQYVLRGGAWNSSAQSCRSAYRSGADAGSFSDACFNRPDIGFRCARNHDDSLLSVTAERRARSQDRLDPPLD